MTYVSCINQQPRSGIAEGKCDGYKGLRGD
jgi:hypothetical protein